MDNRVILLWPNMESRRLGGAVMILHWVQWWVQWLTIDLVISHYKNKHLLCKLIGILGHWNRAKNICSAYYVSVICRLPIATFSLRSKSLLRVMIRYNTPTFCSPMWKKYPSENLKITITSLTQFFESSWHKSRRMELNPWWKIYLISLSTYWF